MGANPEIGLESKSLAPLWVVMSTLVLGGTSPGDPGRPAPLLPSSSPPVPAAREDVPKVRKLGDGNFAIGAVRFHAETRHITFPAEVNIDEASVDSQYKLEYAIVDQGPESKLHESLLSTAVGPFEINLAMKLLRYKASPELVPLVDGEGRPTGKYPAVPADVRAAARVEIALSWKKEDGTAAGASVNEWITNTIRNAPMLAAATWVYGGSFVTKNGVFGAAVTGDIAGIAPRDNSGLFFYPGKGIEREGSAWTPTPGGVIPPKGTPVTVTIKPASAVPKPGGREGS